VRHSHASSRRIGVLHLARFLQTGFLDGLIQARLCGIRLSSDTISALSE
jgi:hypothetical protein